MINKKNAPCFTQNDEKVFSDYLQFCGIGLRNAQLYEKSQLEVKRNQVRRIGFIIIANIALQITSRHILSFVFVSRVLGSVRSRTYDFRRTEHNRAYGFQNSHSHTIVNTVPKGPSNYDHNIYIRVYSFLSLDAISARARFVFLIISLLSHCPGVIVARSIESQLLASFRLGSERPAGKRQRAD